MIIASFTTAAILLGAFATDTVVVGHKSIRPAPPRIGVDTTEIFVTRNGQRQRVGQGVQVTSRTATGMLVVFVNQSVKGVSLDSIFMSAETLAPTRHVEAAAGRHSTLIFSNGKLRGPLTDSTGTHSIDIAVPSNHFDFSVIEKITNSLPLAVGYDAVILAYDVALMKDRAVGFAVTGRENILWNGRDVECWKTVTDFGTHKVTRFADVATRRDLRWEISMGEMKMEGVAKNPASGDVVK